MTDTRAAAAAVDLADGEWHRLHPASPLLRGGLVLLGVLGFVLANLRERVVEFFIAVFAPEQFADFEESDGGWRGDWGSDPIGGLVLNGLVGWALLGFAVLLVLLIAGFWLSWRMHTFRITDEAVEVRSGILFRSHRSARLDRIQGINVNRPLFARLFGTAKLEVSVAGQSANVDLSYLQSSLADALRATILRLASGARAARAGGAAVATADAAASVTAPEATPGAAPAGATTAPAEPGAAAATVGRRAGALVTQRVDEFLAPELDPSLAPPESVVRLPIGRVIASTLLGASFFWLAFFVAVIVVGLVLGQSWVLFSFVPAAIGVVSFAWTRISRSLRYSIAGTPDGVRIGYGLLSTANQTIPPGRVHAVAVNQSLLWRPFGWWSVTINVAGQSVSEAASDTAQRTLVLPVGLADDVQKVLELLLPDASTLAPAVAAGMTGRDGAGGYTRAPRSARWLHPFTWRRLGWTEVDGVALLRRGALLRTLVLVPLARLQSAAISSGPLGRALGLASVRLHTVLGPVTPVLPAASRADAEEMFERVARDAVDRAATDATDHWGRRETVA